MSPKQAGRRLTWRFLLFFSLVATVLLTGAAAAGRGSDLQITLPDGRHPYLACTVEELERLRQMDRAGGSGRRVVAALVKEARGFIGEPIRFPPRGGQHNQWYQCDQCETALQTIDETHHQCPKCKKVYSGHPYDDVIFSRQHGHNLRQMETAAWAYAICGREEFAGYAASVLLGYADRYRSYPYHSASLKTDDSWGKKAGGTSTSRRSPRPRHWPRPSGRRTTSSTIRVCSRLRTTAGSPRDCCCPCSRRSIGTRRAKATGRRGTTPP